MREDFLHYIWKTGQFDSGQITTTDGQPVTIFERGKHNHLAGPDFLGARIGIRDVQWAGSVEIHLKSSDWLKHKHSDDPLYHNVVLHVVWEEDKRIQRPDGSYIPCITMRNRVSKSAVNTYRNLMLSSEWVPCAFAVKHVPALSMHGWLDRLMVERLEAKNIHYQLLHEKYNGDIARVFFQLLCRNFGFGMNHEAFDQIAQHLDYHIVLKHKNDLRDVESLLFGMAGFLEHLHSPDDYTLDLYRRFSHWKKKYGLIPRNKKHLHFFKLRPANFPTIRLAQLAFFITHNTHLVSKVLEYSSEVHYKDLFDIRVSEYWKNHYNFGKPSKRKLSGKLSTGTRRLLLINTIVPFLYYYGIQNQSQEHIDRALSILQSLPPESNHIIRRWKTLGIRPESALDSQALLHLKKFYCDTKKCMHCSIGHSIVKGKIDLEYDNKN